MNRRDYANNTYERGALLILFTAVRDLYSEACAREMTADFSTGNGLYITPGSITPDEETAKRIEARMKLIADADFNMKKLVFPKDDAYDYFRMHGMEDKRKLYKYMLTDNIEVDELDGYRDMLYGPLPETTGCVDSFALTAWRGGFVLTIPDGKDPDMLPVFKPSPKVFTEMEMTSQWYRSLGITNAGELNDVIASGNINDLILMNEAAMEKFIGIAADRIAEGTRVILIAGPSSSGKTTFANRLRIQMRNRGFSLRSIETDNYFKDREDTPLDADGNYDFEALEALDTETFNRDMLALLNGEEVLLPTYNFITGKREYEGEKTKLKPDEILIAEGIHNLDPRLTENIPDEYKYRIYISSMTQLNVDDHNRIHTTDARLLRRIIRDHRTRGHSASATIARWQSVRNGEEKYIFPFQEEADMVVNSALIYELPVLKPYCEPVLFDIEKGDPSYAEARRLLRFLDRFIAIPSENIPANSLLREFIGGSCFS